MDDTELTRMAIGEIVKEVGEQHERKDMQERKVNPLGRANKRFLGRTLKSAMTHNKRKDDQTHASCKRKLKELDKRQKKRRKRFIKRRLYKGSCTERSTNDYDDNVFEVYSSSTSTSTERDDYSRKQKKQLKKRQHESKKAKSRKRKSRRRQDWHISHQQIATKCKKDEYDDNQEFNCHDEFVVNGQNNILAAMQNHHMHNFYVHAMLAEAKMQESHTDRMVDVNEAIKSEFEFGQNESMSSVHSSLSFCSVLEKSENDVFTINVSSDFSCSDIDTNKMHNNYDSNSNSSSVIFDLRSSSSGTLSSSVTDDAITTVLIRSDLRNSIDGSKMEGTHDQCKTVNSSDSEATENSIKHKVQTTESTNIQTNECYEIIDLISD